MKKVLYTLSFTIFLQQLTLACSCIDTGSFCESIGFLEEHGDLDFNIVHARIESQNGNSVNISVLSTLRGSASVGSTFTIIDGGWMCDISTGFMQVGETYIFVLQTPANQAQYISACGTFHLQVVDGKAVGNIAPGIIEINLWELESLPNCNSLEGPKPPKFQVLPTLVNNQSVFAFPDGWDIEPTDLEIRVYDVNGRLRNSINYKDFQPFEPIEITTDGWAPGVYFCQFLLLGVRQTVKIVKVG